MDENGSDPPRTQVVATALEQVFLRTLQDRRAQSRLRQLKSSPANWVDFSSNDFLSLATTPAFRQDFLTELQSVTFPLGSTGSRLLDGNSTYAEELERNLACFHGAESGLLTNSGYDANVSIFMCLPQPGDIIVFDELIHASVHDGMKASRATSRVSFRHNCTSDLTRVLQKYQGGKQNVFIAVESVYSMDGDLAPLQDMVAIMNDMFPTGNCHLIVDEAHATGVYGPKGRGRVSELGLEKDVFIRLHTFGKALACNGAVVLCSEVVRLYLINYARPLIYTTFMSYAALSAIKVAYCWMQDGKTENLFALIEHLHVSLHDLAPIINQCPSGLLQIPQHCPDSPIFALVTSKPRELAAHCQAMEFNVRAVVAPTVPEGTERVRVCLHSGNDEKQIRRFVECVRQWLWQQATTVQQQPRKPIGTTKGRTSMPGRSVVSFGYERNCDRC